MATTLPHPEMSAETKRSYLREWAKKVADGDPAKLPVVSEARAEIKRHFGPAPGAGLGTDSVAQVLREVRAELNAAKGLGAMGERPRVGRLERVARIIQLMLEEDIQTLTISSDGSLDELRRFQKA